MFYAIDNNDQKVSLESKEKGGRLFLTLKKESFENADRISIVNELISAKVGDDGFFIVPRRLSQMRCTYALPTALVKKSRVTDSYSSCAADVRRSIFIHASEATVKTGWVLTILPVTVMKR